ncbi:MAG: radical SAM protein, partial [Calditrichaeota bacterium]
LVQSGFFFFITAAQTWEDAESERVFRGFRRTLRRLGYTRPRIKIIPPLRIGREKVRSRGYDRYEYITREMMADYDDNLLQCTHGRMVTDKGVYVCPILIDYPDARIAETLSESFLSYPLKHQACYTCYISGAICHNFSTTNSNN